MFSVFGSLYFHRFRNVTHVSVSHLQIYKLFRHENEPHRAHIRPLGGAASGRLCNNGLNELFKGYGPNGRGRNIRTRVPIMVIAPDPQLPLDKDSDPLAR